MRPDSQISAPDVPAFQELGDDPLHRRDRDRDGHATRQRRGIDAEHPSTRINERTAEKAVVDGQVEPQQRVDLGAVPGAPRAIHAAHHAPARRDARPRAAERDHELAHFRRQVGSETRGRHALGDELQDREVGARVAPREARRGSRPIGKRHGDVLVAVDCVMRRDDHPRSPMDAARGDAPSRVYRDHRPASGLHGLGELGRKGLQHCGHVWLRYGRASAPAHVDRSMGQDQGERHRPNGLLAPTLGLGRGCSRPRQPGSRYGDRSILRFLPGLHRLGTR